MASQPSRRWLLQQVKAIKQAAQVHASFEPDHVDRIRHLCSQQLAGLLGSQHALPTLHLLGVAHQASQAKCNTWTFTLTQQASRLVASIARPQQSISLQPVHSHLCILPANQIRRRLHSQPSSLKTTYDHSVGLGNAQLVKTASQSQGKRCAASLQMLLPRMYSLTAQQVLAVIIAVLNTSDREVQKQILQSAMQHPTVVSSTGLQHADVPLELLHNTAGAIVKLAVSGVLQHDDNGMMNNIVKAVAGRTRAVTQDSSVSQQGRHGLGTIESSCRMMYALAEAPRHLVKPEIRRDCMRRVLHSLMARMPTWDINVAPSLFNHMSRLQLQDEPVAMIYVLAYAHAIRHKLEPKRLAYLLYGFGSMARQNMRFCGALLRPDISQIANAAARDVAAVLQDSTTKNNDAQARYNGKDQPVNSWVWPPQSVSHVQDDLLSRPRSGISEDQIDKDRLLLYVLPHGPGQPAHQQDMAPWLPTADQAGLPPLYPLEDTNVHGAATPIQWMLDFAETLSPQLHKLPDRELALSLWSMYMSHLVSVPFLEAMQQVLLEKATRLPDQTLALTALGMTYQHVRGATGPAVAALAHAYAVKKYAASLDVTNEDLQATVNLMHAMGIADQAGSKHWRQYVVKRLQVMEESNSWDSMTHSQVRQLAGYLTVLRELEWEAARLRGDPGCPAVLWQEPPPVEGLIPWQEDWLRTLEPKLWQRVGLEEIKETASSMHQSVRSTCANMIHQCGAAWHAPLYETPREDKSGSMDILLTSKCGHVKVNIEADGPWHFAYNDPTMLRGDTARRIRAQARRGYLQLLIPWWEYHTMRFWDEKVRHMQQRMEELLTKAFPQDPELVRQLVGQPLDEHRQWAAMVLHVASRAQGPKRQLEVRSAAAKWLGSMAEQLKNLRMMRTGEANSLAGTRTHTELAKDMMTLSAQLEAHCAALASKLQNMQPETSAASPAQLLDDPSLLVHHAKVAAAGYLEIIRLGDKINDLMKNVMQEIQQVRTSIARKASMRGTGHEGTSAHFVAGITSDTHHEQKKPQSLLQLHNDLGDLYTHLSHVVRRELACEALHHNATWVLHHQDVLPSVLPMARELLAKKNDVAGSSSSDDGILEDVVETTVDTRAEKYTGKKAGRAAGRPESPLLPSTSVDVDGEELISSAVATNGRPAGTKTQLHDEQDVARKRKQQPAMHDKEGGKRTAKKARKSAGQPGLPPPPPSMLM